MTIFRPRPIALLAAAALLAAPALLRAQTAPAPADTGEVVELRFAWAPGSAATVTLEGSRVRTGAIAQAIDVSTASTYRLVVEPHPRGRLVRMTDFRFTRLPELDSVSLALVRATGSITSSLAFVVDEEGSFVALEDAPGLRARLQALVVDPVLAELGPDAAPQVRQMLASFVSDPVLSASASQEWSLQVGTWVAADLEIGVPYEVDMPVAVPFFPGAELSINHQFVVRGRVPCTEGAADSACVALEMVARPDPEAMRELVHQVVERLGAPAAEVESALAGVQGESTIEAVMEPSTLRPHRVVVVKTSVIRGSEGEARQVERRDYRYTWER